MSIAVSGTYIEKTDKAVCIAIDDDPNNVKWIPLSVIREGMDADETPEEGEQLDLNVATWWAEQNGLG